MTDPRAIGSAGWFPARARSAFAALVLVTLAAGCAAPGIDEPPRTPGRQSEFHLPPEFMPPLGACRIWYIELPAYVQPTAMSCARAHSLAARHGGRVVSAISKKSIAEGRALAVDYGPGSFSGVPVEKLPPPGYCRAWHDRIPEAKQPPAMPCSKAEQLVRERGGRLVYMPGPEMK
jgi:hypothetical protein